VNTLELIYFFLHHDNYNIIDVYT